MWWRSRALARRLPLPLLISGPIVFLLGLASAAFHATLTLPWQRADEALENVALAALLHGASAPRSIGERRMAMVSFLIHSVGAAVCVVALSFALFAEVHVVSAALGAGCTLLQARDACEVKTKQWRRGSATAVGRRIQVAFGAAVLGALAWAVDRFVCPTWPINPQLHAWWHIGGAVALHEAFNAAALAATVLDGLSPHATLKFTAGEMLSILVPGEKEAAK